MYDTSERHLPPQDPVELWGEGLEIQRISPPGGDTCVQDLCAASIKQYEDNSVFRKVAAPLLRSTGWASSVEAAMHWRIANQHNILRNPALAPGFPGEYDEDGWHEYLERTYQPHNTALRGIRNSLSRRKVGSNLPQRYDPIALWRYMSDLPNEINVLDVGCSQNLGLKALAMSDIVIPGANILQERVQNGQEVGRNTGTFHRKSDDKEIPRARDVLARPFGMRMGLGVDIMGRRKDDREWVRNSFRPAEIQNGEAVSKYDYLSTVDPLRVKFHQADITKLDHERFQARLKKVFGRDAGRQMIHLAIFSTMMYQLDGPGRQQAIENVERYMHPDGFIVVQDYIEPNGRFSQNWFARDYTYRMMVRTITGDWQEAFVSKDGRCGVVHEGKDLAKMNLPGYKELFAW